MVASPTGDLARNLGKFPNWESSQRPFDSQAGTQSTEPHQPGPTLNALSAYYLLELSNLLLKTFLGSRYYNFPLEKTLRCGRAGSQSRLFGSRACALDRDPNCQHLTLSAQYASAQGEGLWGHQRDQDVPAALKGSWVRKAEICAIIQETLPRLRLE